MSLRFVIFGLVANGIGALLGFSGLVVFSIFENKFAALFASLAMFYSILSLFLHMLHILKKLEIYSSSILNQIKCFSICSVIVLLGILAYVLFLIVYWKTPFDAPVNSSLIIVGVWVFLSLKYAYFLASASSHYSNLLAGSERPLLRTQYR